MNSGGSGAGSPGALLHSQRRPCESGRFGVPATELRASTLLSLGNCLTKDVALTDGALAFVLLIGLQFVVTWTSIRVRWVRKLVIGEPMMLLYRGEFLPTALRRARVTEDEVRAAVRSAGLASLEEAEAVVLETDGSFSAVRRGTGNGSPSLGGVQGPSSSHQSAEPGAAADGGGV